MTATAAAVTEKAVAWVKKPAATGGKLLVTVAGSTDVGGYVYCAVSKTGSRRLRMLNTTNASNATKATTTTVAKEPVNLQSSATSAKYFVKRTETKTGALTFSHKFESLAEGKAYEWMCEATSLSPVNPSFRTAMEKGTVSTDKAPIVTAGDKTLWSSLFAAILMIAAVFFY